MTLPLEIIETIFDYLDIEQILDNYKLFSEHFLKKKITNNINFLPKTYNHILIFRKYSVFKLNENIFDRFDHNKKMPSNMLYRDSLQEFEQGKLWENDLPMSLQESNKKFKELNVFTLTNPNEYVYDYKKNHKMLFNKVLKQLQNKQQISELTIVEYIEKYENYIKSDKSFKKQKLLESLSCSSEIYKIESESSNLCRILKDRCIEFNSLRNYKQKKNYSNT